MRALAADPPRFIVTLNRNLGFFSNSARYYFILRAFVQERYVLAARFGRYDVLRRRELPPSRRWSPTSARRRRRSRRGARRAAAREPRRAVVQAFLDRARGGRVTPLGRRRRARRGIAAPAPARLRRGARRRIVPYLAHAFETRGWRVQNQAAARAQLPRAERRRAPLPPRPDPRRGRSRSHRLIPLLDPAVARRWLRRGERRRSGRGSSRPGSWRRRATSTPSPCTNACATKRDDPYLELVAAHALVRLGRLEYLCDLVEFLGDPTARQPGRDAEPAARGGGGASRGAGALPEPRHRGVESPRARGERMDGRRRGAPRAAPALREALQDPEPRVRMAAAWALGRLGAP